MCENVMKYNGKTMTASEYYYDCTYDVWDKMFYPEAIIDRKYRAWKLFTKLYNESQTYPMTQELPIELSTRMRKVKKAFDDNQRLVDEKNLII